MEDKIKELEKQIAELKEQLKKQKEPEYERWRAELGDDYWSSTASGARANQDEGDPIDNYRYAIGDYFRTREEAESYEKKLIAYQTVKDDAKGFEPDWEDSDEVKWNGYYDLRTGELSIYFLTFRKDYGAIYFRTEEDIKDSQKKHEAEWKLLLGVED